MNVTFLLQRKHEKCTFPSQIIALLLNLSFKRNDSRQHARWKRRQQSSSKTQKHNTHTHTFNTARMTGAAAGVIRGSCWITTRRGEKNKFFNPGGCLGCELLDHMASAPLGVFPLNGRICLTADGERNPPPPPTPPAPPCLTHVWSRVLFS